MEQQTLGTMIAALRKEHGMTQLDLARQLGITDKAVSKWERDLSCPDIASLPKLAEVLGVSVDELMQVKTAPQPAPHTEKIRELVSLICKAVALAMGVGVAALSALGQLDVQSGLGMLGIGLACAALALMQDKSTSN